jgi:hypothetical protein
MDKKYGSKGYPQRNAGHTVHLGTFFVNNRFFVNKRFNT